MKMRLTHGPLQHVVLRILGNLLGKLHLVNLILDHPLVSKDVGTGLDEVRLHLAPFAQALSETKKNYESERKEDPPSDSVSQIEARRLHPLGVLIVLPVVKKKKLRRKHDTLSDSEAQWLHPMGALTRAPIGGKIAKIRQV